MVCEVLGIPFNNVHFQEAAGLVLNYMDGNETKIVFTPNPEFIMCARKDKEFFEALNNSNLNVADGIGVVMASEILGQPLCERVAGCDLINALFDKMKSSGKTVYFFGSAKGVAAGARQKMEKKYKGLQVVGTHDGYFTPEEENIIIEEINELKPDLLLVGIGFPKQEKWIYKHKDELNAKVIMGIGGSLDVLNGNVKRAPAVFIKLNIEWLYRLIKQPSRFVRMLQLPLFLLIVMKTKIFKK